MANSIAQWFADNLQQYIPVELILFIMSISPIMELRGSMIVASILNVNIIKSITICFIANIIPVPFVIIFANKIFQKLKNTRIKKFIIKTEQKVMSKKHIIDKYGFIGLMIITGLILPGMGAWTASIIAGLLKIPPRKAFFPIFIGLILCVVLMTFISYIIPNLIANSI